MLCRPELQTVADQLADLSAVATAAMTGAQSSPALQLEMLKRMLECPVRCEVMRDPVMAEDGFTYEREAIQHCLGIKQVSPMTNLAMGPRLVPNRLVKSMIAQWEQLGGARE